MRFLLVCGVFSLSACAPATRGEPGDDDGPPVEGLVIMPTSAELTVVDGQPVDARFQVIATHADGSSEDVTARATYAADPFYGLMMDDGTYRASGDTAGVTPLAASFGGRSVSASLTIRVLQHQVDPSAPPGAGALFDGSATVDPGQAPELVYPPPGVTMPRNLGGLDVHWRDGHGHDAFEVVVRSQYGELHLVRGAQPGWLALDAVQWSTLARGDTRLSVELHAGSTAQPGTIGASEQRPLQLTDGDIAGGLYYWAATSTVMGAPYGVFRHDVASAGQQAEPFFTTSQTSGRCVACHAISRDGRHMAVSYDQGDGPGSVVDVASQRALPDAGRWNFAAYTPSGDRLLTMFHGVATWRDPDTGAELGTLTVGLPGKSSEYDFAADGSLVAFMNSQSFASDYGFYGASIGVAPFDPAAHTTGAARILVPSLGENNFYPSISPDAGWVLFNRSQGDGYDDPDATLWTVAADGGSPVALAAANGSGQNQTNSWSRWAPFAASVNGEPVFWITFSSKRDFGVRMVGEQRPQIWMAPFYPARAAMGLDPSGPAFWLPFQNLETNNHIAQWTEAIVPIE